MLETGGIPVNVGRLQRIVSRRVRRLIEHRDGACRVPGCTNTRGIQVHHIVHWEDGGPTNTANLYCLCRRHHRLLHQGHLAITGNADHPDGLTITDRWNRPLEPTGVPKRPDAPPPPAPPYHHPTGQPPTTRWAWYGDTIPA